MSCAGSHSVLHSAAHTCPGASALRELWAWSGEDGKGALQLSNAAEDILGCLAHQRPDVARADGRGSVFHGSLCGGEGAGAHTQLLDFGLLLVVITFLPRGLGEMMGRRHRTLA